MLSLHTGYDTAYLTDAVGSGAAATDYYTGAKGEPPGYWQGAGAAALGLKGLVDADVMKRLYHEDAGPDGQVLVRRQRKANYPAGGGSLYERIEAEVAAQVAERGRFITPEEERAIRLRERAKFRTLVPFYDYTFSAPKTVSVLWASLLQAAAEAAAAGREADAEQLAEQAEQVRGAVKRANDRMIDAAERELAYVRTGHHSATSGEYRDAEGFIVASFQQHDARDGNMQLHVHNAIANRARRADGADDRWRALHGHPLFANKLKFGTLADRFLAQELEQLGWRTMLREDGQALEVGGISGEAADAFSARAKELRDRARELALEYEQNHGHAPGKRAWFQIKQQAALETRDAKDHNPPAAGEQLSAWARQAEQSGAGKLAALHQAAAAYAGEHEPGELPGDPERRSIIRRAAAAVQKANATWSRSQLIFELGQAIPALPGEVDPEAYLSGLADEALSGRADGVNVLQIAPVPDLIDVTRLGLRKDGTSIYRPPGEERFCTAEHADREKYLVDVAVLPVPRRVTPEAAASALAGTDLDYSQREACAGLLTSGRLINCLAAPAGTGKTHVMAAFARTWTAETRGRVIGLTASTNAARVMAEEAAAAGAPMETANIAQFLGKIKDSDRTRGHMPVYPGDVLVVDEASQVSTEDMGRIVQVARQCGARVIAAGDTGQLEAVDAGGMFRLIAARHGSYRLTEVRRFRYAWERDASVRLREGDVEALAEYDARGRIYHGPQDRVFDDAVKLWLNGHLSGRESLLMATSNETAARLSRLARERLAEFGLVGEGEITLADGNPAGRGDLARARLNTRIDADGQTLANRDTIRIEGLAGAGDKRMAVVTRQTGPGEWSRPFFVPAAYLEQSAELAYAGNVYVAQGRTVDHGHLVVDSGATRSQVYTGATRGREKNTIHTVTGPADPAQPGRAERDAYADAAIKRRAQLRRQGDAEAARAVPIDMPARPSDRQLAPWEAILAQALQQDQPERTALEEIQAAQDWTTNTGHLLELSEAFWRLDVVPQIDEMVRQRVTPREYERYRQDPERPAFLQQLRAHEIGGRRIGDVLDVITAEPMTGLRSIAAGLHGRLGKEPPPARGETRTWSERAPQDAPEPIREAAGMLDARQAELGRQLAGQPPRWALEAWGHPRAGSPAVQAEWQRRAALVQSYREAAGITDPAQAIGPVPSGQAQLREAFDASVAALELPDDEALLRAMGRGELDKVVDEHDRAAALAPPDVQAQIGERELAWDEAQARAHNAGYAMDAEAAGQAEAEARDAAADLARLAVADAARREWAEAHADLAARAEAAERELRGRDLADRTPDTDAGAAAQERETPAIDPAEWATWQAGQDAYLEARAGREAAETSVQPRETPAINPAEWARLKAAQDAHVEAQRQARAEAAARACPVTDAELEKYGRGTGPEPGARPEPEVVRPQSEIDWQLQYRDRHPELFDRQARQPEPAAETEPETADSWESFERDAQAAERALEAQKAEAEAEGRAWPPENPRLDEVRRELAGHRDAEAREAFERDAQAAERALEAQRAEAEAEGRAWPPENPRLDEVRQELAGHRETEARELAARIPLTDAEVEQAQRAGLEAAEPEVDGPDVHAEIHDELQEIGRLIGEASARMDAEDARRAEAQREWLDKPSPWHQPQPQARPEAGLESSWQPGDAGYQQQAEADTEMEAEI